MQSIFLNNMNKLFFLLFFLFSCSSVKADATYYKVIRVVDGDTFVLQHIGKVRLIGVNTPETKDPRRPVQFFGKEASQFLTKLITGKNVRLEYDQQRKDKFQRTLAYAYLEDKTFINAKIIEEGYGFAYTRYPFQKMELFRSLEKKARESRKGLWHEAIQKPSPTQKKFECSRKRCKHIKTCEEARYLLKVCGHTQIDNDGDGIPCEKLCH